MSDWITSLSFAILVVALPFTFVLKVLQQLPRPLALSHRRWPMPFNFAIIAAITGGGAVFIRDAYYDATNPPAQIVAQFLIAAIAYAFGLVLLLRQFSGVYPEFIVTTGRTGLALRKTRYRNIQNVETADARTGETRLRIRTARSASLSMTLPTRYVPMFYDQMRKKHQDG